MCIENCNIVCYLQAVSSVLGGKIKPLGCENWSYIYNAVLCDTSEIKPR